MQEHGFCVLAVVTGNDPSCDAPETSTCTLAAAPFRAWVRNSNAPPVFEAIEIVPEAPLVGEEVLLRARVSDRDRAPRADTLTVTWEVAGKELTGSTVRHRFNVGGFHDITVSVSDGFETISETRRIEASGPPIDPPDAVGNGAPLAPWLALLALALGARVRRR